MYNFEDPETNRAKSIFVWLSGYCQNSKLYICLSNIFPSLFFKFSVIGVCFFSRLLYEPPPGSFPGPSSNPTKLGPIWHLWAHSRPSVNPFKPLQTKNHPSCPSRKYISGSLRLFLHIPDPVGLLRFHKQQVGYIMTQRGGKGKKKQYCLAGSLSWCWC